MENAHSTGSGGPRSRFERTNCTCSFCLRIFSMRDPSDRELSAFFFHLETNHGLKFGVPEP